MRNLILSLLCLLLFVACNSGGQEKPTSDHNDQETTENTTTTEEPVVDSETEVPATQEVSTWEEIESYVAEVEAQKADYTHTKIERNVPELDYFFEGYAKEGKLIIASSEWGLEPASEYKLVYFMEGKPVYIVQRTHGFVEPNYETFTFIERKVWLSQGNVLKAVEQRKERGFLDENSWDFSGVEETDFTPEPDVLSIETVVDGFRGQGEWAE